MPFPSVKQLLLAASSFTAAMAAVPVEDIAKNAHIPVKDLVDLLNIKDYSKVAVEEWCPLLQQPVEAVQSWPDDVKEYVFGEISTEISILVTSQGEDRVAVEAEGNALAPRDETIRRIERQLLSVHNARIQSGRNGCFQNWGCGACVTAAGLTGTAAIAGCVGAAFAAVGGTAGIATPIVVAGLIECGAKAAAAVAGAVGVCHSAL
ncbi:hypothetical protein ACET3X_002105 [Alternaria dauci]|uniref:Uncharacterized protein n=1 Tax=Alternaria dauci TaxID=48095 RepID=A0ABR3UZZ8_9PLEO